MKKIDFGQTITVLANLGVIAGIVFLAVEIQQNTESLTESRNLAIAQANQERAVALDESYRSLANSDHLPAVFLKYEQQGIGALSPEERLRLLWQSCSGMNRVDVLHSWYERGYVEQSEYDLKFRAVVLQMAQRWEELGMAPMRPTFRAEVERIIQDAGLPVTFAEFSAC